MNHSTRKKITVRTFSQFKHSKNKITMLTAYDYPIAKIADEAGIHSILVGDSLGMVVLGYENTLSVTMDAMIHHCKAVARGAQYALLIGDMPFLSYQASIPEAIHNAGRFLQEGGMDAIKLEGGKERVNTIKAIVDAGIPVMGHIGLTPQSVHQFGGFKAQGKTGEKAKKLVEDAFALQEAGCFSIVLESIPDKIAAYITKALDIPTIGIGAGRECDGQVLVSYDLLGLFDRFTPKFVKQYSQLHRIIKDAFQAYHQDVITGKFPSDEHSYSINDDEWESFLQLIK